MQTLLKHKRLKQASIDQTLVDAARPRSTVPPISFDTPLALHHKFGSKWLLTVLSRRGHNSSAV